MQVNRTSSAKQTPKHVKPASKDIQPSDCTPELNPEVVEQLHIPNKKQNHSHIYIGNYYLFFFPFYYC